MNKKWFFIPLLLSIFAFTVVNEGDRIVQNNSFNVGEGYIYKVKYGFFTIGEAKVDLHESIFKVNNRPCFRVNVLGRTAGLTSLFKVKNTYRSYIDTLSFVPQKFIFSAREGNYKKDQTYTFKHESNIVERLEKDDLKEFNIPDYVQDVVSSYYFLRIMDFEKLLSGEILGVPLFFDDELYPMKIKFAGYDMVKTKFGKIKVLRLNPILPENELFDGEEAIRIYVSDDNNRVPIRLEVDFSFGTVKMEMVDYKQVKTPFNWIQ